MDKYVRGKVLGKGSFGCAILVTSKADGKNHVIKEVDISRMPKTEREQAEQEAKLLLALNHPNIVRCSEAFVHQQKLCIVMDFCSEGDLYGIMQKRRGVPLSEDTVMDFFVQMCLGLKHVHDRKILHRDLKSQNVFVSSGGLLKLGDFGVSKVLNSTYQLATTAVGTPYYLSPEICANKRYNQKTDIWSLGCLLYEITVGRHAFEATGMRDLTKKIIKGVYPPPPSSRSPELRELIARMLTVDWNKRPSINDILAMPIMKARITRWLSSTLRANEFSHTIIHGKPKPGQLVVQSAPPAPGMTPPESAAVARNATPPSSRPPSGGVGAAAVQQRAVVPPPASNPGQRPDSANARNRSPLPAQPGMLSPAAIAAAAAGGGAASAAAKAAEAARQRAISAQREMEVAAARKAVEAAEVARREAENRRAREAAAAGANREIERMRLEDARKKLEQDKNRMDADRRAKEAAKVDDAKRAAAAEEARKAGAAVEAKRAAAAGAARAREEQEARRKEAERAAKEREKEEVRNRMAAQRKEYEAQQRARGPQAGYDPPVQVAVPGGGARAPRKQWVVDEPEPPREAKVAPVGGAGGGNLLSAEQRRAAFDEGRAELQRNRQRAAEAERHGGIAAFLGVPAGGGGGGGGEGNGNARLSPEQRHQAEYAQQAAAARRQNGVPSPEQGRDAYFEGRAAAERNKRNAQDEPPVQYDRCSPPPGAPANVRPSSGNGADPYGGARRQSAGEAERKAKEAAFVEFQAQHYREMKEAAKRNKQAVMAELGAGGGGAAPAARSPSPLPPRTSNSGAAAVGGRRPLSPAPATPPGGLAAVPAARRQSSPAIPAVATQDEDQEDMDFAAMVQDMQDVLVGGKRVSNNGGAAADDDLYPDEQHNGALEGRFMLNGKEVVLPVKPNDPLGLKVEALRMFLERQLGTAAFLKVYHRMEAMCADDDETEISRVFLGLLGPANLPYLSLVHQLIVCEENMHAAG